MFPVSTAPESTEMAKTNTPFQHGHTVNGERTPTYYTWQNMIARCRYPSMGNYEYYGGRGVTVDPRWDQFVNFLTDMGERPESTTLDRIDPYGDYTVENCRWATRAEQQLNRRDTFNLKAACRRGHLYTIPNTRLEYTANDRIVRHCRICARIHQADFRERRRQLEGTPRNG